MRFKLALTGAIGVLTVAAAGWWIAPAYAQARECTTTKAASFSARTCITHLRTSGTKETYRVGITILAGAPKFTSLRLRVRLEQPGTTPTDARAAGNGPALKTCDNTKTCSFSKAVGPTKKWTADGFVEWSVTKSPATRLHLNGSKALCRDKRCGTPNDDAGDSQDTSPDEELPSGHSPNAKNLKGYQHECGRSTSKTTEASCLRVVASFKVDGLGCRASRKNRSDHPAGRACDYMVPVRSAAGDAIADYVYRNAGSHNVKYLIWKQRIRYPGGGWQAMADRGSVTANHYDHVHVSYKS